MSRPAEGLDGRRAPTMKDLAERYMKEHSRVHKKPASIKVDERNWTRHILPKLGHRKVQSSPTTASNTASGCGLSGQKRLNFWSHMGKRDLTETEIYRRGLR